MQQNGLKLEQLKEIAAITISLRVLAIAPIFIKLVESELSASATIFNCLWGAPIIFGLWSRLPRVKSQIENSPAITEIARKDYIKM